MKFNSSSVKALCSRVAGFLIILGLSASISGCEWGDKTVSLVAPNPDEFAVFYSDSSTVQLSTVAFDSVQTGGATRLLIGRYTDPYFGKVHAMPFAQPQLNSPVTLDEKVEYDSVIVALKYDKYFYGDTTKKMTVRVHELQSNIFDRSNYFNTSTMPYNPIPMGGATFYPRPTTDSVLNIRLSDVFGKKIFALAKNNQLNTEDDWYNALKGIVIIPDASDNNAVIGFSWSSASTSLQLHYHTVGVDGYKEGYTGFLFKGAFDQILSDKTGTPLVNLPPTKRLSVPSSQTGNQAYIQSGVGLATRVDFPTVKNLKFGQKVVVNRAFLKVYPKDQSITKYYAAPPSLHMYRIDKNNEFYIGSGGAVPLTTPGGVAVSADLVNDYINNEQYYLFDVSMNVINIVLSDGIPLEGILIMPSSMGTVAQYPEIGSEFAKSVTRLVIGDQKSTSKRPQLQVYYTKISVENQ